jgi:hypothetical protein
VVQNMVPTHRRATAAAILLFFVNLVALGGGPPFTGWLIDQLSAFHFAHPGEGGIGSALADSSAPTAAPSRPPARGHGPRCGRGRTPRPPARARWCWAPARG